jgi:hypothetical protein
MAEAGTVVDEATKDVTELEKIEPTRVDGVGTPANGFPILMMKSIAPVSPVGGGVSTEKAAPSRPAGVISKRRRAETALLAKSILDGTMPALDLAKGVDESADIAGGYAVVQQLARLIVSEATELGAGHLEEKDDIALLLSAVCALTAFIGNEKAHDSSGKPGGDEGPAMDDGLNGDAGLQGAVSYKAAASDEEAWPDGTLVKFVSAAQRRTYASSGVAMPNGDFPIADEGHLRSAVGHYGGYKGDKAAAKRHIIRRAKKLGLTRLLPDDWEPGGGKKTKKSAMLRLAHESEPITPDVIKSAVAEAVAASEERFAALEAELAKVKATPIPGGPLLVTPLTQRPAPSPSLQKAARYRAIAAQTSDPAIRQLYLDGAAREEGAQIAKGSEG